jgi:sugar phosphate isomerase/epimerase
MAHRMNLRRIDRREFLSNGFAAAAAAFLPAAAHARKKLGFFEQHALPIGLQLYTVADAVRDDLDGTLAKVARIGYRTVELAGFHGHEPAKWRAALDRTHLKCTSIHIQGKGKGDEIALDGDIPRLAAAAHTLGTSQVVMPMFLPSKDWGRIAEFLNIKGAALQREGITLGYHNHNPEFEPVGNTTGFDIIARNTDRELVVLELDVGWVAAAGLDPAVLFSRYPGRFRLMHVKDIKSSTQTNFDFKQDPTEVGHGMLDWPKLLPAAYAAGVRDFYVEQEPPFEHDRFEAIAASFTYLSKAR